MTKTQILIIGMGGVGSIASYALEYKGLSEVTAVVRSDYDLVTKRGYNIDSTNYGIVKGFKPTNVVKSIQEAHDLNVNNGKGFEYVIVTLKNLPDISPIEDIIGPAVTENTTIVLIQNGIGIERDLVKKFPNNSIISGVSMIGSTNINCEVVQHVKDILYIGPFIATDTAAIEKAKKLVELYNSDKNECTYDHNVKKARWRKLVYNACFNTTAALVGVDVGRIQESGADEPLILPMMDEIYAIAKADGVELEESIKDVMLHANDGVWYVPSMLVDLRKGNYMELEIILGNALRIGKEYNVSTPRLDTLYQLLKIVQFKLKEEKGKIVLPEKRPINK